MSGISDVTMSAMTYALGGVTARADVRADNMANASTPGFRASTVKFEDALGAALRSGADSVDQLSRPQAVLREGGTSDPLGNDVSFEDEMVGQIKDNLLYESFVHGFNYKASLLRTAVGGRS